MGKQRLWQAPLGMLILAGLPLSAAQAATIKVDGTACTLADAITAANTDTVTGGCKAGSGEDTIKLKTDVTLAAALPSITSAVVIEGNGRTIDGNQTGSVFTVIGGDLTLNNATVTGGIGRLNSDGTQRHGGGIYNKSGAVTLNSVTVSGNTAGDAATIGYGGGIVNSGGTFTLNKSTVSGNSSTYASGGIHNSDLVSAPGVGSLTLNSSTVSGNVVSSIIPNTGFGGGITNLGGTVTLNSSAVKGNSSSYSGGGIHNQNPESTLIIIGGSTVSGNTAAYGGGGITNNGGAASLSGSTVSGNKAASGGGGIGIVSGKVSLTDCTVSGNMAALGGGIANDVNGAVTMTSAAVIGNTASQQGGGIGSRGSLTMTNSTVSGNTVSGVQGQGGGIGNDQGSVILTGVTVSGNKVPYGAGGGIASSGAVTLKTSLVSGNTAAVGREVFNLNTVSADSFNLFGHSGESNAQAFYGLFSLGGNDLTATSDGDTPTALAKLLSPLADNGGPTLTHALVAGSPAVDLDADCAAGLRKDQRGAPRPIGHGCDAGSLERGGGAHLALKAVNALNPAVLIKKNKQVALAGQLEAAVALTDLGLYGPALRQLQDTLGRTDGCAAAGQPDKNDWIVDCASQAKVQPLLQQAIEYVQ